MKVGVQVFEGCQPARFSESDGFGPLKLFLWILLECQSKDISRDLDPDQTAIYLTAMVSRKGP